jgi:histidinol-phosphatase (PHP family)
MHTRFSADGQAAMQEMCDAALAKGLSEICFTEHVDWIPWDETRDYFRASAYVPAAQQCISEYAGRLVVRMGLEISEPHLMAQEIRDLLNAWPFDFVIGSAHWIDQTGLFMSDLYQSYSVEHVEREYFQRVYELVQSGDFDSLGHLDLVRRYRPKALGAFRSLEHEDIIRAILRTLIARDRAFEINTSPLRRGLEATCPDLTVLRWYRELGGEKLTIGSDAHRPDQVGTGFDTARAMLHEAGFTRVVRFERRVPQWVSI